MKTLENLAELREMKENGSDDLALIEFYNSAFSESMSIEDVPVRKARVCGRGRGRKRSEVSRVDVFDYLESIISKKLDEEADAIIAAKEVDQLEVVESVEHSHLIVKIPKRNIKAFEERYINMNRIDHFTYRQDAQKKFLKSDMLAEQIEEFLEKQ